MFHCLHCRDNKTHTPTGPSLSVSLSDHVSCKNCGFRSHFGSRVFPSSITPPPQTSRNGTESANLAIWSRFALIVSTMYSFLSIAHTVARCVHLKTDLLQSFVSRAYSGKMRVLRDWFSPIFCRHVLFESDRIAPALLYRGGKVSKTPFCALHLHFVGE